MGALNVNGETYWERKCKNVFIELRQIKTKMIAGPFCAYRQIHFIS